MVWFHKCLAILEKIPMSHRFECVRVLHEMGTLYSEPPYNMSEEVRGPVEATYQLWVDNGDGEDTDFRRHADSLSSRLLTVIVEETPALADILMDVAEATPDRKARMAKDGAEAEMLTAMRDKAPGVMTDEDLHWLVRLQADSSDPPELDIPQGVKDIIAALTVEEKQKLAGLIESNEFTKITEFSKKSQHSINLKRALEEIFHLRPGHPFSVGGLTLTELKKKLLDELALPDPEALPKRRRVMPPANLVSVEAQMQLVENAAQGRVSELPAPGLHEVIDLTRPLMKFDSMQNHADLDVFTYRLNRIQHDDWSADERRLDTELKRPPVLLQDEVANYDSVRHLLTPGDAPWATAGLAVFQEAKMLIEGTKRLEDLYLLFNTLSLALENPRLVQRLKHLEGISGSFEQPNFSGPWTPWRYGAMWCLELVRRIHNAMVLIERERQTDPIIGVLQMIGMAIREREKAIRDFKIYIEEWNNHIPRRDPRRA